MDHSDAPGKLYYTIGEVSRMTGLPASVLRFWETEFRDLRPTKIRGGKRLYRKDEIQRVLQVKKLLYEDRFTIEGARKHLRERKGKSLGAAMPTAARSATIKLPVEEIRQGLKDILEILES